MPLKCALLPTYPVSVERSPVGYYRLLISLCYSCVSVDFSESSETVDGSLGSHSSGCRELVSASSDLFACGLAFPDADSNSSNAIL